MTLLLPLTLATAAACALINLWLAIRAGRVRSAEKISIGDGGHPLLAARMRAQLNFAEYVPVVLVLLALVEAARGANVWLWTAAATFVIARIAHVFGMDGWMPGRAAGIITTVLMTAGLALYAIVILATSGTPDIAIELPPAAG